MIKTLLSDYLSRQLDQRRHEKLQCIRSELAVARVEQDELLIDVSDAIRSLAFSKIRQVRHSVQHERMRAHLETLTEQLDTNRTKIDRLEKAEQRLLLEMRTPNL